MLLARLLLCAASGVLLVVAWATFVKGHIRTEMMRSGRPARNVAFLREYLRVNDTWVTALCEFVFAVVMAYVALFFK
jgi:hypothetical protein